MIDQALRDKVKSIKAEYAKHGQHTGPAYALRYARYALTDEANKARFRVLGGTIEHADYGRAFDSDYELSDGYDLVRVLIVDDESGFDSALDFDCCTTLISGTPDKAEAWRKCDCVVGRNPEDVTNVREHSRTCQYGQVCKHKCDEAQRIEREGTYGICAQYRLSDGTWERADECWGYVGDDWEDTISEFIASALDGYDKVETETAAEAMALTGEAH